jgi:hypothetical protein
MIHAWYHIAVYHDDVCIDISWHIITYIHTHTYTHTHTHTHSHTYIHLQGWWLIPDCWQAQEHCFQISRMMMTTWTMTLALPLPQEGDVSRVSVQEAVVVSDFIVLCEWLYSIVWYSIWSVYTLTAVITGGTHSASDHRTHSRVHPKRACYPGFSND